VHPNGIVQEVLCTKPQSNGLVLRANSYADKHGQSDVADKLIE